MRNFANYHVDVRRHTSGVVKTICEQCLPTRHNKRDRSLRVNIDTGHCHCHHCGADFYVPDDAEERAKAERQAARKRRAASAVPQHFHRPVFDASKTTLSEATERWLVETRCIPQSVIAGLRITEQEAGKIQTNLLLGAALAEGTAIFGFVVALLIILFLG